MPQDNPQILTQLVAFVIVIQPANEHDNWLTFTHRNGVICYTRVTVVMRNSIRRLKGVFFPRE